MSTQTRSRKPKATRPPKAKEKPAEITADDDVQNLAEQLRKLKRKHPMSKHLLRQARAYRIAIDDESQPDQPLAKVRQRWDDDDVRAARQVLALAKRARRIANVRRDDAEIQGVLMNSVEWLDGAIDALEDALPTSPDELEAALDD